MKPGWNPAPRMDPRTRTDLEAAAITAERLWPDGDVIGELIAKTLRDVTEFGYQIGGESLARRLAARVQDEQRRRDRAAA
jgi:hypothetical protein